MMMMMMIKPMPFQIDHDPVVPEELRAADSDDGQVPECHSEFSGEAQERVQQSAPIRGTH